MMKKYDCITIMDTCVDLIISGGDTVPRFGQAEQMVTDYVLELGGSACIFASQLAKLGLRVAGVGKAGMDVFGDVIIDKLNNSGVITELIERTDKVKTGITVAICKPDDRAMLTCIGSIDTVIPEDITDEILSQTRHIHIASYFLIKGMQRGFRGILKKAKECGVTVSLDSNWDPAEQWDNGLNDILPYVDVFLPNEQELLRITGELSEQAAVDKLLRDIPVIVVKKGKAGAVLYTRAGSEGTPMYETNLPVIDAIGAGDSFDGGFIYGYLTGRPLTECLEIGCITGGYNTTAEGGVKGQIHISSLNNILDVK